MPHGTLSSMRGSRVHPSCQLFAQRCGFRVHPSQCPQLARRVLWVPCSGDQCPLCLWIARCALQLLVLAADCGFIEVSLCEQSCRFHFCGVGSPLSQHLGPGPAPSSHQSCAVRLTSVWGSRGSSGLGVSFQICESVCRFCPKAFGNWVGAASTVPRAGPTSL